MNTMRSHQENARTLAAALGLDVERAAPLLEQPLQITWPEEDAGAAQLGYETLRLLRRTFSRVGDPSSPCHEAKVELLINDASSICHAACPVYAVLSPAMLYMADAPIAVASPPSSPHPILVLLAACYASANLCQAILSDKVSNGPRQPLLVNFSAFISDMTVLDREVEMGVCHMAGAGAVGNAFLYALRYLHMHGELIVIDPKDVNEGILQRCLWFDVNDAGNAKAEVICRKAQAHFANLRLTPFVGTVADYRTRHGGELARLIVGVDSRRARRLLQAEIPGEVFDASTTGIEEVVFHHHRQCGDEACLACVYPKTQGEITHEQHIAEMLNVSLVDIAEGFISSNAAVRIHVRYPHLTEQAIVGKAYDSLFKALCGTGQLRTAEDRQVLAPLAFVSQLAGTVLAIEFMLRMSSTSSTFNYWRLRPWNAPNVELRRQRRPDSSCEVCQDTAYRTVAQQLWK